MWSHHVAQTGLKLLRSKQSFFPASKSDGIAAWATAELKVFKAVLFKLSPPEMPWIGTFWNNPVLSAAWLYEEHTAILLSVSLLKLTVLLFLLSLAFGLIEHISAVVTIQAFKFLKMLMVEAHN